MKIRWASVAVEAEVAEAEAELPSSPARIRPPLFRSIVGRPRIKRIKMKSIKLSNQLLNGRKE